MKGPSKTWISHSNATKCMRYNYAKCTCFFFLCGCIIHLCEGIVLSYEQFNFIIQWNIAELEWKHKTALTKHSASRNRFSVQPEGNLRQDDGHDAREVGLNHKIANFPFQMEICCHHYIFAWAGGGGQKETDRVNATRAGIFRKTNVQVQTGICENIAGTCLWPSKPLKCWHLLVRIYLYKRLWQ